MSLVQLLGRDFELDPGTARTAGASCVVAILPTPATQRILEHLGLPARAPPRTPARVPMSQATGSALMQGPDFVRPIVPRSRGAG